jgi:hypothetical protein
MPKFSDADRERIRAEAMQTLQRPTNFKAYENNGLHYSEHWPQPEPAKRERDPRPAPAAEPDWSAWNAWCDARIRAAVERERAEMIPIIGEAIGKLLDAEADRHKSELAEKVAELKLEIARLHNVLAEFRITAAGGGRAVLDLPPLPARDRSVN